MRLQIAAKQAETHPERALAVAANTPPVLVSAAMAEVGQAAAKGGDPSPVTFDRFRKIAAVAPLQPEPFLVEAAMAERAGDYPRANALLNQARLRDPRSTATRYLLADLWLRQNEVLRGLREMAVLVRLVPDAKVQLIPALSQYAQTPGARENLASILAENPNLKQPLFAALAADPGNAELLLALAQGDTDPANRGTSDWETRLLWGLVGQGKYDKAYGLWQRFAGIANAPAGVFNGDFRRVSATAPFNWSYSSASAGLAEPRNGQLRVLFYGREDASLTSQLLLLPPGHYRFQAPVAGSLSAGTLAWQLSCFPQRKSILMNLQLGSGAAAATFTVPAGGCDAQMLQLNGLLQDSPQETDVKIGPVTIEGIGT